MDTDFPSPESLLAHEPFVRSLARRLISDEDAAQDLVQDTWLRALTAPARRIADPRAWLGRIVRNLATDRHRSERTRAAREREAHDVTPVPSVDESVARLEAHRRLVAAVLALDEPYRGVVLLAHFHGLAPRQVAARLGRNETTVRSQLHRAHARLRARLDAEYEGEGRAWAALLLPEAAARVGPATGAARAGSWSALLPALLGTVALLAAGSWLVATSRRAPAVGGAGLVVASTPPVPAGAFEAVAEGEPRAARVPLGSAGAGLRIRVEDRGAPVPGARVLLLDRRAIDPVALEREPALQLDPERLFGRFGREARADEGGVARFSDVPEEASGDDWVAWAQAPGRSAIGPLDGEPGTERIVALEPAGDVALRVLDADGAPAVGVPVALCFADTTGSGGASDDLVAVWVRDTDAGTPGGNGAGVARFLGFDRMIRLERSATPRWSLRARVPGASAAQPVAAVPGRPAVVELRLPPTGTLLVRTVDADGTLVATEGGLHLRGKNRTGDAGRDVPLHAGTATLSWIGLDQELQLLVDLPARGLEWRQDLPRLTRAGERATVDLRLPPGPRLEGRALDETGAPLANVRLQALVRAEGEERARTIAIETDRSGGFVVVPTGSSGAGAAGTEAESLEVTLVHVEGGFTVGVSAAARVAPAPRDARDDRVVDLGDRVLRPTSGTREILVVDRAGAPVSGVQVQAPMLDGDVLVSLPTDADGTCELQGAFPDEIAPAVERQDWVLLATERDPDRPERIVLRVGRGGSIAGTVRFPDGIEPGDAMAWVFTDAASADAGGIDRVGSATVDPETGAFEVTGLPAGSLSLRITRRGARLAALDGVPVALGERSRDPRLDPVDLSRALRRVRVRVVDGDGAPVGAQVELRTGDRVVGYADVRGDAAARLDVPLEGPDADGVELRVSSPGFRDVVLPAPARDTEVTLHPGIAVELYATSRLVLRSGEETASLSLRLESPGGGIASAAPAVALPGALASGGHVRVLFPAPGRYRLFVSRSAPAGGGAFVAGLPEPVPGELHVEVRESDAGGTLPVALPASVFE